MKSTVILLSFACSLSAIAEGQERPLPQLLQIDWHRGPDLPQGFQDSDGGIVGDTLISVGGFCSGQKGVAGKDAKYPRGFLQKVWGLPVDGKGGWVELPQYPGSARQGLDAVVVKDQLYCWGGFSYDAPFTHRDGYRLSKAGAGWGWERLPDLPWPLCAQGTCAIGSKIYAIGGADYDGQTGFFTAADRAGNVKGLGAKLLVFDTDHPRSGWKEGKPCPGTPRWVHAVAVVDGRIHVFGGAAAEPSTFTVVDNWRFDPARDAWDRLPDLPVASGNFPSGPVVYAGRYVLLIGGYQYGQIRGPDGALRPTYGTPTRKYPDNAMCSDIFVYDAKSGTFGRATPMPLNNNLPMAVVAGDRLFLIGGEIGAATIDGVQYGHHPDLCLIGTLSAIP